MGADGSHNSSVPPPFLTKTYEMVDDPITDNIVSWSENSSSFVVWNVADFTKDLLPQYFKHNNFSSFVRQLNTYGFHKIDPDRQEFANDGFAKGNKEGLKHIHRRKPSASPSQKDALNGCNDPAHAELEGEIQKLKEDKGMLINELVKVKQLQETTEMELETLGQRLQALEERQHRIMTFLGRAMHNPAFTQFIQHGESLALSKKRRLPEQGSLIGIGESWDEEGGQLVRYSSGDTGELMSEGQIAQRSEGVSGSESSLDFVLRRFAVSTLNQSDEASPLSHSSGVTLWEMQSTMAEHATNVEAAGNCAVRSPSEAVECSDFICQGGDLKEDVIKADIISLHISREVEVDHDKPTPSDACNKDRTEGSKACGSNDVFWESMLTENPRLLTDRDSQDSRCEGHSNERWFL